MQPSPIELPSPFAARPSRRGRQPAWAQRLNLRLLGLCLLGGLLLPTLPGCAEGIVLDPPERFHESEIVLPTPEPSPSPSPSTPVEKIQVKFLEAADKANKYRDLSLPIGAGLAVLFGFFRLLRWIYELTTSSPPLA